VFCSPVLKKFPYAKVHHIQVSLKILQTSGITVASVSQVNKLADRDRWTEEFLLPGTLNGYMENKRYLDLDECRQLTVSVEGLTKSIPAVYHSR
jgi:hypothetical protein